MIDRWKEIEFYYYLKKLMTTFNDVLIIDYIEAVCNLARVPISSIKVLASRIRSQDITIIPNREETVYIARQLGISFGKIESEFGIANSTQRRLYENVDSLKRKYAVIGPRLDEYDRNNAVKFMQVVKKLKEI